AVPALVPPTHTDVPSSHSSPGLRTPSPQTPGIGTQSPLSPVPITWSPLVSAASRQTFCWHVVRIAVAELSHLPARFTAHVTLPVEILRWIHTRFAPGVKPHTERLKIVFTVNTHAGLSVAPAICALTQALYAFLPVVESVLLKSAHGQLAAMLARTAAMS